MIARWRVVRGRRGANRRPDRLTSPPAVSVEPASFEHMLESWYASRPTPESAALLGRVRDAARTEARAAAERLVAIDELFVLRCRDSGECEHWAMDTWDAVAAQ
jgi:hypothetical protein